VAERVYGDYIPKGTTIVSITEEEDVWTAVLSAEPTNAAAIEITAVIDRIPEVKGIRYKADGVIRRDMPGVSTGETAIPIVRAKAVGRIAAKGDLLKTPSLFTSAPSDSVIDIATAISKQFA